MAALAVPTTEQLQTEPRSSLIALVQTTLKKAKSLSTKNDRLARAQEAAVSLSAQALDYGLAGLGGGVVGYARGSIQASILAGEEGYDEESLLIGGFGVDTAIATGMALAATAVHLKGPEVVARGLRSTAMGAFGAVAARLASEHALAPDEEETEEEDA